MSSIIRQDLPTKDWTIFSEKRAERPYDFKSNEPKKVLKEYEPGCPFCTGNEEDTPEPLLVINGGESWSVRVVKNKFPAVQSMESFDEGSHQERHMEGPYLSIDGAGEHEVIIESPRHDDNIIRMKTSHIEKIITAYRRRFIDVSSQFEKQLVIIFKNHGRRAGASLDHPHSQLVAIPFVPEYIRHKVSESQKYFDKYVRCVYCDIIKHEIEVNKRIICENRQFIALAPYASSVPYNLIIYPRKHLACFAEIKDEDISSLAGIMKEVLGRMCSLLDDPDYNFVIDTSTIDQCGNNFYHWHLEIMPRLNTRAGFEIGSGMNINHILPETCVRNLRNIKYKPKNWE
jgi:UDPglucose--hexose-1-phosphate uridylyltransferase